MISTYYTIEFGQIHNSPRKVLQIYSEIWLPDLDSEKWLSSLFSIRLN